jgi:hypothetical protein
MSQDENLLALGDCEVRHLSHNIGLARATGKNIAYPSAIGKFLTCPIENIHLIITKHN